MPIRLAPPLRYLRPDAAASVTGWCSWCGEKSRHQWQASPVLQRPIYQCRHCGQPTVRCRLCDNMARAARRPAATNPSDTNRRRDRIRQVLKGRWNHELCAEHDGSTLDFRLADRRIADLGQFKALMRPRQRNVSGLLRRSALVAGGAAAVGTGAWMAAPGIAAALGAAGLLGSTAGGTAIASLKGAALGSAAMTKIGGGGVAAIAAAGAGLGGKTGLELANAYFKDIPDFDFVSIRPGETIHARHEIIVVNGFLTEKEPPDEAWRTGLDGRFAGARVWQLQWESKSLRGLGRILADGGAALLARETALRGLALASRSLGKRLAAGGWALAAAQLAGNPWHSAMVNAEKAGLLLAEAIRRSEGKQFTLLGHSLGARVVFFALRSLANDNQPPKVRDAILLGAAVGRKNTSKWQAAASAVSGGLYNCHSERDAVLRFLYQGANLGLSKPAGIAPVATGAINVDCGDLVAGHAQWKPELAHVLERLDSLDSLRHKQSV